MNADKQPKQKSCCRGCFYERLSVSISGHRGKSHVSSLLVNVFLTIAIGVVWFVFGFHEDGMNCMNLHRAFMI